MTTTARRRQASAISMGRRCLMAWWVGCALISTAAPAATLKIACELALCKQATDAWAAKTGHDVQIVTTVGDSNDRLTLSRQLLEGGADKIDVIQMDVVWPAMLSKDLVDLRPYTQGVEQRHLPQLVANDTVGGRLVAMPWFADVGLLYFRKDLLDKYGLSPPRTWDELTAIASRIQSAERAGANRKMWGFVWQGRAYEGLTCNALEWMAGEGGGTIVDGTGRITVNNPAAVRAVQRAARWVGTISPRAVLDFAEDESLAVFAAGNAVFLRQWPYAWAMSQRAGSPVKGKVGVMQLPAAVPAGPSAPVLGGWQLGVSIHSAHPALAADLVLYLTGAEVQKQRALQDAFLPTLSSLYDDPAIARMLPVGVATLDVLRSVITRPSSITRSQYATVSERFWTAVHGVLEGSSSADRAAAALETSLQTLRVDNAWK